LRAVETLNLVDIEARHLDEIIVKVLDRAVPNEEERTACSDALKDRCEDSLDNLGPGVALLHEQVAVPGLEVQVLVRVSPPLHLRDPSGEDTRFVWILLSDKSTHSHLDEALEFGRLMRKKRFRDQASLADDETSLTALYLEELDSLVHFQSEIPEELRPTGRFCGALLADIKRRLPLYVSDFTDGMSSKSLGSSLFLFFACLAPAIAFGGLLSVLTKGAIGALEMIVATAICGTFYALSSAQPLTILGSTGPVIIFMGLLYGLCERMQIPYLPTLSWVGLWTMVILLVLAVTDACCWIRYFTRFTDETFAALISLIFIVEAVKEILHAFHDPSVSYATALLSLVLALGTYSVAKQLSGFRRSPYLRRWVREFLADFGPAIAIIAMAAVAFGFHEVELQTLEVPQSFGTTSGRPWLVNPLEAPQWVWAASFVPAVLVSILLYLDQNITVRLVNNPDYNLKKGSGYHLDLVVVGLLVGICSILGLPWMVAATVRSLNHVRSLTEVETDSRGQEQVVSVVETRVTGLLVHLMIAGSLLVLPWLKLIPMSVLFGLFLFMGIASMAGNQLFERLRLWVMDPGRYPTHYYLRAVPAATVHKYTAIQLVCLTVLWVVKASVLGILFPLFIALLVPVRMSMDRYFRDEHLALLDAEEMPEEEELRTTGP
jgi:HCO3- transporter family protein